MEKSMEIQKVIIKEIPTIALRGMTVLPNAIINFDISRKKSIKSVEQAMIKEQKLFLVTQLQAETEDPTMEDVFQVGCVANVKQVTKLPDGNVRVMVEGFARANLVEFIEEIDYLLADIEMISVEEQLEAFDEVEKEAMLRLSKEMFLNYSKRYPKIGKLLVDHFEQIEEIDKLIDLIIMNMPLDYRKKQHVLEATNIKDRYDILIKTLTEESRIADYRQDLVDTVKGKIEKNQREYFLREQLKYIREELGDDTTFTEIDTFLEQLDMLQATEEVKNKIRKEINRYKMISSTSSESAVERGYIETLLELPWQKKSTDNKNMKKAEKILGEDHYGLLQVKERIMEFLAVRTLTKQGNAPIICLVGPPGTGKTSIAKTVAKALDKEYVRISLGGVHDEAEIRGHRKTYVGAMPGRIVAGLKQAGVNNPLMLLDEIDKVSSDHKGDTSSALLEVLDSEQNNKFRDHYVEVPVDLSEILFIATDRKSVV